MGSVRLLFKFLGSARAGRGRLRVGLLLAFLALWATSGWAAAPRLPDVLDARVTTTPDRARLIIDLSGSTEFAVAFLDSPERIAIDVKANTVAMSSPGSVSGAGLVSAFNTVLAEDGRARMELTLNQPAIVQQAYFFFHDAAKT